MRTIDRTSIAPAQFSYDQTDFMSRERLIATPSQTVGPFFYFGLVHQGARGTIAGPGARGERVTLHIRVTDGDELPVPDAIIELWQADADGRYVRPADPSKPEVIGDALDFLGYGRMPTSKDGACVFETIRPGPVADPSGQLQAPHIDVCFFARGLLRQIYTRIYFAGDSRLTDDVVLASVPADRRATLIATPVASAPGEWSFDIRLQGANETVFFDL
jgi:protocatechuate 3,4-dioxygenase alpha subunit